VPQNEDTKIDPISPYGIAKAFAHNNVKMFRESYGMWACSGILYNHSSFYRGEEFVTKKITKAIARIKLGKQDNLELRDIDHIGDWGYAEDYVKAMHLMLQADSPEDYIISSGEKHSLRDMINIGFNHVGIYNWDKLVSYSKTTNRPANTNNLLGDNRRIKIELDWQPEHTFQDWVCKVIDEEIENEQHSLYN
jgi:GDPmannose 4,6-dehydratase